MLFNEKYFILLFFCLFFVSGCLSFQAKTQKELEYYHQEFFNGDIYVSIELPVVQVRYDHQSLYSNVILKKRINFIAGDSAISFIRITEEKFENNFKIPQKIEVKKIKARYNHFDSIRRIANIETVKGLKICLVSSLSQFVFKTESSKQERIAIDDAIFNRIVESIRVRNKAGEMVKPEIVKLPDEVQDMRRPSLEVK